MACHARVLAVAPKPRRARHDESWVQREQHRLRCQPQFFEDARAERVNEDVDIARELLNQRDAAG